jgi:hypothetical protein
MKTLTLHSWVENLPKHTEKQGMQVAAVDRKSELALHHAIMTYLILPSV